jgi:hypothetical protein
MGASTSPPPVGGQQRGCGRGATGTRERGPVRPCRQRRLKVGGESRQTACNATPPAGGGPTKAAFPGLRPPASGSTTIPSTEAADQWSPRYPHRKLARPSPDPRRLTVSRALTSPEGSDTGCFGGWAHKSVTAASPATAHMFLVAEVTNLCRRFLHCGAEPARNLGRGRGGPQPASERRTPATTRSPARHPGPMRIPCR